MSKIIEIPASESISEVVEINAEKQNKPRKQLLRISYKATCNEIFICIACVILTITIISYILMLYQFTPGKQFEVAAASIKNIHPPQRISENSKTYSHSKSFD